MKELNLEEIKNESLEVLINIDKFCCEHGIRYTLAYGTLLGAIRHNGFIPWDDDIDIMMPRKDYEKFINSFGDNQYGVISCNNKNYIHSYAKAYSKRTIKIESVGSTDKLILGVDVDIFPVDLYGDAKVISSLLPFWAKQKKLFWRVLVPNSNSTIKLIVKRLIACLFKPNSIAIKINNKAKSITNSCDVPIGYFSLCEVNSTLDTYPMNCFDDVTKCVYEGHLFNIPQKYDEVLKTLFGDYMTLPPFEERVTHHSYKAYWKD